MKESKVFDELLIIRCTEGDHKAFELLVKRWNKKLIAFTYRFVKDFDLSKDIVQESWVSIFKGLSNLNEPSKFHSWAFRITYNKVIDQIKKNKKKDEFLHSNEVVNIDNNEPIDLNITDYLNQLPTEPRTILTLFYLEELSILDIAEILNLPAGTVKSRIFYAREKLKKIIKEKSYENH